MKIKYVLMSSNTNPNYLDFWPIVAKAWQKWNITPVLFFIPDRKEIRPAEVPDSEVHVLPYLSDVDVVIQTSMARFWGSYLYPDAVVLISDIDIIPLSNPFFIHQLDGINSEHYIHLRCVSGDYNKCAICRIPEYVTNIKLMDYLNACYHVTKGNLLSKVWGFSSDWETSCKKTVPYHYVRQHTYQSKIRYVLTPNRDYFSYNGDELYSSTKINLFSDKNIFHFITYKPEQFEFLTRRNWRYSLEKLDSGYYSAVHLPRPYKTYERAINNLLQKKPTPLSLRFWQFVINIIWWLHLRAGGIGTLCCFVLIAPFAILLRIICRFVSWETGGLILFSCRSLYGRMIHSNSLLLKLYTLQLKIFRTNKAYRKK